MEFHQETIKDTNSELMVLSMKVLKIAIAHPEISKVDLKPLKFYLMKVCKSQSMEEKLSVIPTLSYVITLTKSSNMTLASGYLNKLIKDAAAATEDIDSLEGTDDFFKDEDLELLYIDDMEKVWRVIANVFQHKLLGKKTTDGDDDTWFFNYNSLNCLLARKEREWKEMGQQGLPPVHEYIKHLSELEDKTLLLEYITKLIEKSISSDWDMDLPMPNTLSKDEDTSSDDESLKFLTALGTSFSLGLTFLPQLLSQNQAVVDIATRSAFSIFSGTTMGSVSAVQTLSAGVVSSALLAGVCVYNAYCVIRKGRSLKEAGKNILDQVIVTAATFGWGVLVMSGLGLSSTIWPMGLLLIGGVVIGTVAYKLADRFTRWLFNIPRDKALVEAYEILGLRPTASMDEVRSAYRHVSREYHPDNMKRKDASDEEILEAVDKFRAVQNALQFIIQARAEEQKEGEREGFLQKMSGMFTGLFKKDSVENKKQLALPPG